MHFIHIFFRCGFAGTETLLKTNGKLGQRPRMKSFSRKYFFVFYSLVFMQPKNNSVKTLRKAVGKCARFEVMTRSFCQFPLPPLSILHNATFHVSFREPCGSRDLFSFNFLTFTK